MAEALGDGPGSPSGSGAGRQGAAQVLVVGAGLAGAHLCQRLRGAGFAERIVLVGAEPDLPYDRPPLTSDPGVDTDLARTMGIDVAALADEVLLGVRAFALESADEAGDAAGTPWRVRLAGAVPTDRDQVRADVVVVATGASPLRPAGWDAASLLHTRRQADELWARVQEGARLVVVGGGWIGCEVARTAADRGARVVLVEGGDQLLPGRVPATSSARVRGLLEAAGVEVRLGEPVTAVSQGVSAPVQVAVGDHRMPAEVVLTALGVRPETAWLPGSVPRAASGAVLTDPWGRTSLPGVFALGDAASRWSPRAGVHLAGGHWTSAFHSAETVAPAIQEWLAEPAVATRVTTSNRRGIAADRWTEALATHADDPVPYTFSDLGEHRLLVLGDASAGTEVWREQGAGWTVYLLDERDLLTGVVALDRPRDVVAARKAMRTAPSGRPEVDLTALGDPAAPAARCFPTRRGRMPVDAP